MGILKSRLIFFVKSPVKGRVKTRLAADIGEERALQIYREVAERSLRAVEDGAYDVVVAFYPPDARENIAGWLGNGYSYYPQAGLDLGERMENAFKKTFSEGVEKAVLVGSDIPELNRRIIDEAIKALDDNDAAIGPARDGGYYLIGFTRDAFAPSLFKGIKWGTDTVFKDSRFLLAREGLRVHILPELQDIDRAVDLDKVGLLSNRKKFSVIVPVLHEAENINSLVHHLHSLGGGANCEIIVADGSPEQDTNNAIEDSEVIKVASKKGRATQMNTGAAFASGEILIFLHADTTLPVDALCKIEEVIGGGYIGGAFNLRLDSRHPFIRFINWSAGLRSRITRIPYGDQAIFIGRDYFGAIGGYNEIPLMEDIELMRTIKRRGGRICILKENAVTSARKYIQHGIYFNAVRNHLLRIMYALGVKPETLAKIYYKDSAPRHDEPQPAVHP